MYKPVYNDNTIDIVKSVEVYLETTRLSVTYIDTDDLCNLIGYIKHLENKIIELKNNTEMLKVYQDVLKLKIKDIDKILED